MARYPGAIWLPITASKGRKPLALHNRVNLHVAVSEAASLHSFFNTPGRADSHFYVRKDGTVEQYVDTNLRAFADLEGNDATISVETQGGLRDPNGEPWTPQQVEALARLYAWAVRTHGVPRQIARDSKVGASSHGLSWHRLGIDGNFPALPDARAGRGQRGGGMHYSTSAGKACPGDAKIRQVPDVYARAVELLTPKKSAPAPTEVPSMILRNGKTTGPSGKYLLLSGGVAKPVSHATAKAAKKAGVPLVQVTAAEFKAWS